VGLTGTTSTHWALCMMGMRSFHAEERGAFAGDTFIDGIDEALVARSLSRCQVDALFLEPTTDLFPVALAASPDVKVILTWRDWPSYYKTITRNHQWLKDMLSHAAGYTSTLPVRMIRWEDWWDWVSGGAISQTWKQAAVFGCPPQVGGDLVAILLTTLHVRYWDTANHIMDRGAFKVFFDEESYLAQHDEIRRLTPPGKLLVFNVKEQGWKELEQFTGLSAGELGKRPFPNPRNSKNFTNNHIWVESWRRQLLTYAISSSLAVLQVLLLRPLLRRLRPWACMPCCLSPCCRRHRRHLDRWSGKEKEQ